MSTFLPLCLPYLPNEPSPFGVLDLAIMCLLIRFIKPPIRFCLAHPLGAVHQYRFFPEWFQDFFGIAIPFGADLWLPTTPSDGSEQALRLVGAQRKSRFCGAKCSPLSSVAHKGLFPKESLCGTLKINSLHSCKPKAPMKHEFQRITNPTDNSGVPFDFDLLR